jgi:hypothetical protein
VVGGWGWVSIFHLSPSLDLSSFHCKERKKKSAVLLVCDFFAPGLCVNFSVVGKQSLLSATAELKLFSLKKNRTIYKESAGGVKT